MPEKRSVGRLLLEVAGFAFLAYVAYAIISPLWQSKTTYGPPEAEKLELIVAPGVSVQILPSAKSLADARFDAFDISPSGVILVSTGSRLVDMGSGDDLFSSDEGVRSFAFVGEGLAAIDANGKLGFFQDGRLQLVGDSPISEARLIASSDRTRLLFLRNGYDNGRNIPALASMSEGAAPEVLTGSFNELTTAGGDALQTYFADGGAMFQVMTPGEPSLLFVLPDQTQSITGIGVAGTAVYFTTGQAVYALDEGVAVPLVIGLGGQLRLFDGALYLLDPKLGRVYRISLSKGAKP